MEDNGSLNDAGPTDGEKDLVADFLMREQDKLAGLEDDFGAYAETDACRPLLRLTYCRWVFLGIWQLKY